VTDGVTFTTINVPGATITGVDDINDGGQIVGGIVDATGSTHGFLTDGTTFTLIDAPGAIATSVSGINDRGQIIGVFLDATSLAHGFVATPNRGGIP
jgi:probable HAF family extracellular repeat protein